MKPIIFLGFLGLWLKLLLSYSLKDASGLAYIGYQFTDMLILVAVLGYFFSLGIAKDYWSFFIGFVTLLMLNSLTFMTNEVSFFSQLSLSLKLILPMLFLIMLVDASQSYTSSIRLFSNITLVLVLLLTTTGWLFFSPEKNRLDTWWPAYFSGLHTTSYIWVAAMLLWLVQIKNLGVALSITGISFLILFLGWGVRTATLALLVYWFVSYIWANLAYKWRPILLMSLLLLGFIFTVILISNFTIYNALDQYSSGRLSMYAFKFQTLFDSGVLNLLLGGGAGSDLVYSDIWWWDKKGSHNDYLTVFFEQGIFYFLVMIYLFKKLFNRFDNYYAFAILSVYLFSSLVSNGYMLRPLPSYVLMLALVMSCRNMLLTKPDNYKQS